MPRRKQTRSRAAKLLAGVIFTGAIYTGWGLGPGNTLGQESSTAGESEFHRWSGGGLRVELAPLTHQQALAFFLGRGFSSAMARHIVNTGCVFRSSIGNAASEAGSPSVELDLTRWRVDRGDGPRPIRLIDDWFTGWNPSEVSKPSRIAFRWALFPVQQIFEPSDYNWGLFTFGLPPGTRFDLHMAWRLNESEQQGTLAGLVCAPENSE